MQIEVNCQLLEVEVDRCLASELKEELKIPKASKLVKFFGNLWIEFEDSEEIVFSPGVIFKTITTK